VFVHQCLYLFIIIIVNAAFRALYIRLSSSTCFDHFWPSSGRFYNNMHGKNTEVGTSPCFLLCSALWPDLYLHGTVSPKTGQLILRTLPVHKLCICSSVPVNCFDLGSHLLTSCTRPQVGSSDKVSDLYFRGSRFESWPRHWVSGLEN
jgi:hypothetical protein